ncbi:bicyclomycin resistance protein [Aspergillus indologenus CBS 114.80]|uniref:Bicyclomycin resistance protein n=1 Tax=Aspergillus indologenus CBS 114.80 TaxID=1450541 RepID=A0A2V5J4S0_9EURO|nr:bicyclomycin resistance protein [Aspergillus indologenus CBS 114.80]
MVIQSPVFWRLIGMGPVPTQAIGNHRSGTGTREDPYLIDWLPDDPQNPMAFPAWKKWALAALSASTTVAVTLASSAYTGGMAQIREEFGTANEVATLGVSLYVLGFAVGPLVWASLSEAYGRQSLFVLSFAGFTAFNAGCAGAPNIQSLVILRFLAGSCASSGLTNAGAVISDLFDSSQRGLAMVFFATAPALGPVLGPIIGGFLGMTCGWRWVEGLMAIFSGALWILGMLFVPETYSPVLLQRRAALLSAQTQKVHRSRLDADKPPLDLCGVLKVNLARPWVLLAREPIVSLLSLYMAIIYGILYMLFAAYPIVYQQHRGWNEGVGGLAFLGILVGFVPAIAFAIPDNTRCTQALAPHPEARLRGCMLGGLAMTASLFWFAWTNAPGVHWLASVAAGVPFGFGALLIFLSIFNYLVDTYTVYSASVLAANSLLRSLFGCVFPLFTTYMYDRLGLHWAACVPAFLALACTPLPFVFYTFGRDIRSRCRYAAESARFMETMRAGQAQGNSDLGGRKQ